MEQGYFDMTHYVIYLTQATRFMACKDIFTINYKFSMTGGVG